MSGQKLGHSANTKKNRVNTLECIVLIQSSCTVRMFVFMKSDTESEIGRVGSKPRSLGQC